MYVPKTTAEEKRQSMQSSNLIHTQMILTMGLSKAQSTEVLNINPEQAVLL